MKSVDALKSVADRKAEVSQHVLEAVLKILNITVTKYSSRAQMPQVYNIDAWSIDRFRCF